MNQVGIKPETIKLKMFTKLLVILVFFSLMPVDSLQESRLNSSLDDYICQIDLSDELTSETPVGTLDCTFNSPGPKASFLYKKHLGLADNSQSLLHTISSLGPRAPPILI